MRAFVITLAGAIGGAALAVAVIVTMAANGRMPINDRQMQTYLMLHPELAAAMLGRYQQAEEQKSKDQQQAAADKAGRTVFFNPAIAFVTGPVNAKNSLVEFYDYDCPYCQASAPAVQAYYQAHKNDTRFALIELPIASLHGPTAVAAAVASLAARRQPEHYMDFHFALLTHEGAVTPELVFAAAAKAGMDINKLKADMADPGLNKVLDESLAKAKALGFDGTPTFVLNGKVRPGMVDDASLAEQMKS